MCKISSGRNHGTTPFLQVACGCFEALYSKAYHALTVLGLTHTGLKTEKKGLTMLAAQFLAFLPSSLIVDLTS